MGSNFDRIKAMSITEFINFLRLSDFNRIHPIIEGRQFFDNSEVIAWLNEEVENEQ